MQGPPGAGLQRSKVAASDGLLLLHGLWLLVGAQSSSFDAGVVRVVLAENNLWVAIHVKTESPKLRVRDLDPPLFRRIGHGGLEAIFLPGPGVSEPSLGEQVQLCLLTPAVVGRDLHQRVIHVRLRVLHHYVEVFVLIQDARVEQFVLQQERILLSLEVHPSKLVIRILGLRVFVHHLHVAVGRCGVQVVIELLDVLTVIPLRIRQPVEALLEDGVLAVPQRKTKAKLHGPIAPSGQAVLAPAVSHVVCRLERQVDPGVPVASIILTAGPPVSLTDVRTPPLPIL
mmetsp:Transcript_44993/g.104938  ORF Transcript_44993/g.104938 Transcript_44993/m.104938 type:complete len:285 (+) Transcript_44993:1202-2056(+)